MTSDFINLTFWLVDILDLILSLLWKGWRNWRVCESFTLRNRIYHVVKNFSLSRDHLKLFLWVQKLFLIVKCLSYLSLKPVVNRWLCVIVYIEIRNNASCVIIITFLSGRNHSVCWTYLKTTWTLLRSWNVSRTWHSFSQKTTASQIWRYGT